MLPIQKRQEVQFFVCKDCPRAIVAFYPGWMAADQLAAIVLAFARHGFEVGASPVEGSDQTPVILLGHGFGAIGAADRLQREPHRYAAAAFWDMPNISHMQLRLLLALLKWERFRLGSDVPSRALLSMPFVPPTIGETLEILRLYQALAARNALGTIRKSLPIRVHSSDKKLPNLFEGKGFLNLTSATYTTIFQQELNTLNHNVIEDFIAWAKHSIA